MSHAVYGFNERIIDAHTALGDVIADSKILPEMLNRIRQLYYPITHLQLPSASVPLKAKTRKLLYFSFMNTLWKSVAA